MYSIKELKDILGYTSDQIRLRLEKLEPILRETIRRGKNNKILVTNNGLEILRRAKQLEESNIPLEEVPKKIEKEMGQVGQSASDNLAQTDQNLLEEKNKRIDELKTRIKELKEGKKHWRDQAQELQQKLITGETKEETDNQYKNKSLLQVIKEWLQAPAS